MNSVRAGGSDAEGRLPLMNLGVPPVHRARGRPLLSKILMRRRRRGRKVSEKLFEQAYRLAETRGSDRAPLTREYNAPARCSLYDKIGRRSSFIVYTQLQEAYGNESLWSAGRGTDAGLAAGSPPGGATLGGRFCRWRRSSRSGITPRCSRRFNWRRTAATGPICLSNGPIRRRRCCNIWRRCRPTRRWSI